MEYKLSEQELKDLMHRSWLKAKNFYSGNTDRNTDQYFYDYFEIEKKQLIIHSVVHSKITALVTYWRWEESGHSMIDDSKNKITQIVEVDNLTDINGMFTNLIDVKILK